MQPTLLIALFLLPISWQDNTRQNSTVRIETGVSGHIHPAICVSNKGTLVAVYCKSEYQPYLITRSTDGGKTWSKPTLFPHTVKTQVYPGSLTTLADGRLVHAWNVWFTVSDKVRSRYVAYSVSSDDGLTWSEPRSLSKSSDVKTHSVIRHPLVELSSTAWLMPLMDRTVVYNPQTGQESPFGDGRNHGLVPIVKTAKGTLISGQGLRSTDAGKTWQQIKPFPDVSTQGWRHQLLALRNGWLLASQIVGPGIGGEKINFILSRDDGRTWDLDHPVEFYAPGRPIGGRACPKTVQVSEQTLGTIFYDTDAKQPGGSGVFFRTMPLKALDGANSATDESGAVNHRVLAADRGAGKIAIIGVKGEVEWEFPTKHDVHDLHMLPSGNILTHISHTTVVEINPAKRIVWRYEAKPKAGYAGKVEVHAFQRLEDGRTMIAESGNARLVEVNSAGMIVKEIPLTIKAPHPHRDTRMARKLPGGTYLVCHEGDGCVREYSGSGKVVWEYKLDLGGRPRSPGHGPEGHGVEVFGAVRLPSGNTLIAGGNNNRVLEVNKKGAVVWQIDQKDLPGITLAWVTTLQVLPNGNIVIGNCHAGPDNPQLIEVTRDKKVVWTFRDFKNFGNNLAASQVLDVKGQLLR